MNWRALCYAFRIGSDHARRDWPRTLSSALFFMTVALSYNALFQALPQEQLRGLGITRDRMIWYIMLTDLMSMAMGTDLKKTEALIREGGIEAVILRPVPFWTLLAIERIAEQAVRLICLLPLAILIGYTLSGTIPSALSNLLLLPSIVLCLISSIIVTLWFGFTAAWVRDSRSIFWVFQKLTLVAGGLLCPIALYPLWLQHISWLTPFPMFAGIIGDFAFASSFGSQLIAVGMQFVWTLAFLCGTALLANGVIRKIGRPA